MRKILTLLLIIISLLLSACSATEKQGSKIKNPQAVQTAESRRVTLEWYYFPLFAQRYPSGESRELMQAYVPEDYTCYEEFVAKRFEAKHPNIRISLHALNYAYGPRMLKQAISVGHCDVIQDAPGRIMEYAYEGKMLPLDDLFTEAYRDELTNKILLEACRLDEHYYMYPLSSSPFYLAFNRKAAEEAGVLPLLREDWTINDFNKVLYRLREKGLMPGSVFCKNSGGDQATRSFVANLAGTQVLSEDKTRYTLLENGGEDALSFIRKSVNQSLLGNGTLLDGSEEVEKFAQGKTAFTFLWSGAQESANASLMESRGVETIELLFPHQAERSPSLEYLVNGYGVVDNGDAVKAEAAKQFIKFMCDDSELGPMNVVASGGLPVRKSFTNAVVRGERMRHIATWERYYAPYYNTVVGFDEMRRLWFHMLQAILSGSREPYQAAEYFTEQANRTLQTGKAARQ